MKRVERIFLRILYIVSFIFCLLSILSIFYMICFSGKMFSLASSVLALTALVQVDVSGLFERIFEEYSDDEKYPYGPPSHINREITSGPIFWLNLKYFLEMTPKTGFYIGIISVLFGIASTVFS